MAIIEDKQIGKKYASRNRIDVLIEMQINGKNVLVSIGVNTTGRINGSEV